MDAMVAGASWDALDEVATVGPDEIEHEAWRPVDGCPGVSEKSLWRSGDVVDAMIRYEPGASTPGGPHLGAAHHIWIVAGEATVAGRHVVAGSYVYVPVATDHPIHNVGTGPCLLLQMHRPRR